LTCQVTYLVYVAIASIADAFIIITGWTVVQTLC